MKKVILLLIATILISTYSFSFAENNLNIDGEASVLLDYDTKEILYEKNMDTPLYPASTTKMMTAILAIELGNLNDIVTVDQEVVDLTKGSHIALEPGEQLTLEQLLYALLVQSANDAALAIGKHISGSIDSFVTLMNTKAKELGATNTNFVNPNGLHDESHYSTAHDLALIGQYAMQNNTFRKFVNTITYTIEPTNKKAEPRYLKITNKLLFSSEKIDLNGKLIAAKYENASGVKTGYTSQAQNCLVSYAEKDGQRLIAVVLKSGGMSVYSDTHKLLNFGFDNYANLPIAHKNEFIDNIPVNKGLQPYVAGILDKDILFPISNESVDKLDRKVILKENIEAPISKGEILGTTEFYLDGKQIGEADIISTMDVELDPKTKISYKIMAKWYIFAILLLIIARIMVLSKKSKRRSRRRKTYTIHY